MPLKQVTVLQQTPARLSAAWQLAPEQHCSRTPKLSCSELFLQQRTLITAVTIPERFQTLRLEASRNQKITLRRLWVLIHGVQGS